MNYLAHLYFAKNTPHSRVGNLMGDFMKGVNMNSLPEATIQGIYTHRLIDKFTDSHHLVRSLKPLFTPRRRRYAGLISDVVFDHFLAKHWQQFHHQPLSLFCQNVYLQLSRYPHPLPERMTTVVNSMINNDWLGGYITIEHTAQAIDAMARRIRFNNELAGSIDEVRQHYPQFERHFLSFFPELQQHVAEHNREQPQLFNNKHQ